MYSSLDVKEYNKEYDITPADLTELNKEIKRARKTKDRNYFHQLLEKHPRALRKDVVIDNKYRLLSRLGSGTYGCVWSATPLCDNSTIALKFCQQSLTNEYNILNDLKDVTGVNKVLGEYQFDATRQIYYMPLQLLNSTLDYYFKSREKTIKENSLKTIARSILNIFKGIHSKKYVYRDLSVKNIMLSVDGDVYLVDFGLAISVDNIKSHKYSGTRFFSSDSSLIERPPNYWDDIESVFYVLLYLHRGQQTLPWYNFFDKYLHIGIELSREFIRIRENHMKTILTELPPYLLKFYQSLNRSVSVNYEELIAIFS